MQLLLTIKTFDNEKFGGISSFHKHQAVGWNTTSDRVHSMLGSNTSEGSLLLSEKPQIFNSQINVDSQIINRLSMSRLVIKI